MTFSIEYLAVISIEYVSLGDEEMDLTFLQQQESEMIIKINKRRIEPPEEKKKIHTELQSEYSSHWPEITNINKTYHQYMYELHDQDRRNNYDTQKIYHKFLAIHLLHCKQALRLMSVSILYNKSRFESFDFGFFL